MIPQPLEFLLRAYWRLSRGMTLGVRAVAVDESQRVMLVRHGYMAGWHLPGGGVEHGQTAGEAVAAELAQEAGLRITQPPQLLAVYSNNPKFKNDHVLLYRVTAWEPCTPTASQQEIAERGFFAIDALPEGTTKATRERIAEAFNAAGKSPL